MEEHRGLRGPARAWSIAVMAVLCTVLAFVLLRSPTPAPARPPPPSPETPRPLTSEERRSMYRAWPLFEGWPLPQLPSDEPPPEPQKPPAPEQDPPPIPEGGRAGRFSQGLRG